MSSYNIVRLDVTTIKHLYVLYKSVYKKERANNYFELKYDTAYTGQEHIGFLAFENDKPVAFYGVVPTRLSINGSHVLAAQSCDTMTHPGHRKKGLFIELADLTFKLAQECGIHFIFGFPNQNSYSGFTDRLGFEHKETMCRYTIHFSRNLIGKLYGKLFMVRAKGEQLSIKNNLLEQGFDGIIYDEPFFKYKSYSRNFVLTQDSYSYWISRSAHVFIGALANEKEETLQSQLDILKNTTKAVAVTFMVSSGTHLDSVLSKFYHTEEGLPLIVKDLSGAYSLKNLKFQFADIDIF